MPYFDSSTEWQRQSFLLLKARPTTTRIVTKYHIPSPSSLRHQKKLAKRAEKQVSKTTTPEADGAPTPTPAAAAAAPKQQIGYLELRTYDPESGVCLKYKTDKAAEVGRLIGSLGLLGRGMAALSEEVGGEEVDDTAIPRAEPGAPVGEAAAVQQKANQSGGGGGGKKKKKGKR
ncbi:signal recognition particle 9 kDa protein-domain-containing protein [Delphinella strobiligena]|nr:signal recognition particle 9 kDa protein-domain-containing protein [Delphinella strobiligena]